MLHREVQSFFFRLYGCSVSSLAISIADPSWTEQKAAVESADVVLLSYGNTLFASDRIRKVGLGGLLHDAAAKGTVIMGGSAGAILSFDGGHSDSMDPSSWKNPPMACTFSAGQDWQYIRAPGLGLQPGFICPHHDSRRKDGLCRADDFKRMLKEHTGESALGIDNRATLVIEGEEYRVLSKPSSRGSVASDGSFVYDRKGSAGMWKYIVAADGSISRTVAPTTGRVADLLHTAWHIVDDPLLDQALKSNPDDGRVPGRSFC
jgi:dipeptidase E